MTEVISLVAGFVLGILVATPVKNLVTFIVSKFKSNNTKSEGTDE